jgi:hypothetical protein
MGKTIELTEMTNINGHIEFNATSGGLENILYYPMKMKLISKAKNGTAIAKVTEEIFVGNGQSNPYTPQEIYTFLSNNVHAKIATAIKDMYLNGISLDVTT